MIVGINLRLSRRLCLSLLTSLCGACGSEPPVFREQGITVVADGYIRNQSSEDAVAAESGTSSTAGPFDSMEDLAVETSSSVLASGQEGTDGSFADEAIKDFSSSSKSSDSEQPPLAKTSELTVSKSGDAASQKTVEQLSSLQTASTDELLSNTSDADAPETVLEAKVAATIPESSTPAPVVAATIPESSTPAPVVAAPPPVKAPDPILSLAIQNPQLRFGEETTNVAATLDGVATHDVNFTLEAPAGKDPGHFIDHSIYVSPASGTDSYEVTIVAVSVDFPSIENRSTISLVPKAQVFAGCMKDGQGFPIKANIYEVATTTKKLPNFASLAQPNAVACMDEFVIPVRAWSDGFPDSPELIEWFALRGTSLLTVDKTGWYSFKLNADDGAKFYIDGVLVVDNDGIHAVQSATGKVYLKAGDHEMAMEYFQGPRYHIALELFWKTPGTSNFVYVPKTAFKPY